MLIDQSFIDQVYYNIFEQTLRYNQFYINLHSSSVWNKAIGEKNVLESLITIYKKFYEDRAEEIRIKIGEIKEVNVNSYMTYDCEYHINKYNDRISEVNKYLITLEALTYEDVMDAKLGVISEEIELLFPKYIVTPTLYGRLSFNI
jgi:hypothetical protein